MKLLFLTSWLVIVAARAHTDAFHSTCDGGVYLHSECFDKQTILTDRNSVSALAVDDETKTLFFVYQNVEYDSILASLNLKTNEVSIIDFPYVVFSFATDSARRLLYMGTQDGIYAYNIDTNRYQFYGARDQFISNLFLKDAVLYYCDHYSLHIYALPAGATAVCLPDLQDVDAVFFVLDDDNNIFYNNNSALFRQKKGSTSSEAVEYEHVINKGYLNALALDRHENLYASFRDGVYSVRKDDNKVDIVIDHTVYDLIFDRNNYMIYSYNGSVVRLVPRHQVGDQVFEWTVL